MGRINETIWGVPNSWLEKTYYSRAIGKVATFGNNGHTLYDARTGGNLTFNVPITDYTLSWCGLGQESNYTQMFLFDDNTKESTAIRTQTPLNFMFFCVDSGNGVQNFNASKTNYKNILYNGFDPGDDWSNLNNNRFIQPITEFYINKCVWLIKVECTDTLTNASSYIFDFDDYKNNQKTTYPIILHIFARPYFGETGNRTTITTNMPVNTCVNVAPFNSYSMFSYPIGENFYQDFAITSKDRSADITLFGSPVQNVAGTNNYIFSVGDCKRKATSPRKTYQDENLDDVLESALKTIACFGFYFVLDGETHINDPLDSQYVYMGVIPEGGISHGEYTHGTANRNNLNWNWNNTNDSDYDPNNPPVDFSNSSDLHSYYLATAFTKLYAISVTDMTSLAGAMSTAVQNLSTDVNDVEKAFFTNNPLDVVVSLKRFPFALNKIATFASGNIKLGVNDTGITSQYLAGLIVPYSFGETFIPYHFNDFRDFEPYTTIDLVIPFCGSVRLSPAVFMGHYLRLKMSVDLFTGACCCYIFRDNMIIDSVSGNCAVDLPVTGIQAADLNNAVMNAVTNSMSQKVATQKNEITAALNIGGFAGDVMLTAMGIKNASNTKKQNISGIVSGAFSAVSGFAGAVEDERMHAYEIARSQYQLENIQTPFAVVGSSSAGCSLVQELNSRLIIHRPIMNPNFTNAPADYANINGYATLESGTLSSYTGFTVCTAVDVTGIHATLDETNLIKQALLKGVRIKQITP